MAQGVQIVPKGELMSTEGQIVAKEAAPSPTGTSTRALRDLVPLNPCELEIDLFCKGMRIDPSCALEEDARFISRTRAGLGSGLELVIPGSIKDVWVNVPVEEDFAQQSCYELVREQGEYWVKDARLDHRYAVRIPPEPAWYTRHTSRGTPMHKVGVLQGTYLGIYISNSCGFWYHSPAVNCKFCATGLNVGVNEVSRKDIDDVVDVVRAAKQESGATFVHFNSGYQTDRDLDEAAPYVKAVKSRVGSLVGLQLIPTQDFWKYDRLIDLGTDHFSFCSSFTTRIFLRTTCPASSNWWGSRPSSAPSNIRPKNLARDRARAKSSPVSSLSKTRCAPSTTLPASAPSRRFASSAPPLAPTWSRCRRLATRRCWWSFVMSMKPAGAITFPSM